MEQSAGIDLGHFALVAAWIVCMYGLVIGIVAARSGRASAVRSAQNAVLLTAFFSALTLGSLAYAFVTHQYRYTYVWQHSNTEMPWYYLISSVWGGMDGSMLLWAGFMSFYAASAILQVEAAPERLARWLAPVLSGATGFFLTVVVFFTNPFRLVPAGSMIADGNGLNPLLQNPSMLIHPPMLYAGFTGFVVPCAFCFAALISGSLGDQWILLTRRWTLIAWGFLTTGIILGGNWAYIELGWGGFWAWDPVENASFFPWLTGTAYLHSVMVQERKGMLKIWNASLCLLTYLFAVFGTFLTRSGIVQSVHAFADTDVGEVFLYYIVLVAILSTVLIVYRRKELRPDRALDSYFSREAAFLYNNLALLAICFATLWGVMFPVLSEAITGKKSVVGPPFFNQVNVPLFLFLLFLMGVGPLIAWRRASWSSMVKTFAKPFSVGLLVSVVCIWFDSTRPLASLAFGLSTFVIATVEAEFRRGVRARRELVGKAGGVVALVRRKPRRYGGFLVHLGVAIMAIAITASMAYKVEKDLTIAVGQKAVVGRYALTLEELRIEKQRNYEALISRVRVEDAASGSFLKTLEPERRFYTRNEETTTEVAIRMTPRDDLYLALAGSETAGAAKDESDPRKLPAIFKVFINPLQVWLWFGGIVVLFGTVILIGPALPVFIFRRAERTSEVSALR